MVSIVTKSSSYPNPAEDKTLSSSAASIDRASLRHLFNKEQQPKSDKRISVDTCETAEDSVSSFHPTLDDRDNEEMMKLDTEQEKEVGTSTTTKPRRKNVNFDTITIREFARALGDNPATTHGPPLSLDWDYEDVVTISVDDYEKSRPPRRITDQMVVPGTVRENILLSQTRTTKQQIKQRISEVKTSRHKRQVTVAMQDFEEWHVLFEFISRRFRRMRTGISKQKEQEMLWEQAQKHDTVKQQQKQERQQSSLSEDGSSSSSSTADEGPLSPFE
jgi:hypothetical protein